MQQIEGESVQVFLPEKTLIHKYAIEWLVPSTVDAHTHWLVNGKLKNRATEMGKKEKESETK